MNETRERLDEIRADAERFSVPGKVTYGAEGSFAGVILELLALIESLTLEHDHSLEWRDDARAECDKLMHERNRLRASNEELARVNEIKSEEISLLREALRKHGEHMSYCAIWDGAPACTCGLDVALAGTEPR